MCIRDSLTTTSNGRYSYKDNSFHGRTNLMRGFEDNPELYETLKQEVEHYATAL